MAEILILGRIWVEKRSKNTKCACFLITYLIYYYDYLITTFLIKKETTSWCLGNGFLTPRARMSITVIGRKPHLSDTENQLEIFTCPRA